MLIIRRLIAVSLAAGVLLALSGCSKIQQLQSAISSVHAGPPDISQWTADTMTQAFAAINAKIGADPADYRQVLVNELSVSVQAIDPHKRENVDTYTYAGKDVEVKPVDVSGATPGAVDASVFKSDTVKPAVLAQLMAASLKDSGVENPKVEWVMIRRFQAYIGMGQAPDQPQIQVEAKGPRGSKIVHYDLTGQLVNVTQG